LIDGCKLTDDDKEEIQCIDEKILKHNNKIQLGSPTEKKYHKSKIQECDRNKSRIKFMRFLYENLPIEKIAITCADIPEIYILLNAFQI
jgi:hypothetical protein